MDGWCGDAATTVMVGNVREIQASYSIPAHSLKRIIRDLAEHGHVNYGSIPIEFAESPDARYVARQVVIASVRPGSSAERAGLRSGDVLRRLALLVGEGGATRRQREPDAAEGAAGVADVDLDVDRRGVGRQGGGCRFGHGPCDSSRAGR